jgi:predicted Zn-dependent peptidase
MNSVVADLARAPLNELELERAKRSMLAQLVLGLETPGGFAHTLADLFYNGMSKDELERRLHELSALTTDHCREIIARQVTGRAKVLVVLGDAKKLKSALGELGPVEVINVESELR